MQIYYFGSNKKESFSYDHKTVYKITFSLKNVTISKRNNNANEETNKDYVKGKHPQDSMKSRHCR